MNEIEFKIGWAQLAMHRPGYFCGSIIPIEVSIGVANINIPRNLPADGVFLMTSRRAVMLLLDDMFALWVLTKAWKKLGKIDRAKHGFPELEVPKHMPSCKIYITISFEQCSTPWLVDDYTYTYTSGKLSNRWGIIIIQLGNPFLTKSNSISSTHPSMILVGPWVCRVVVQVLCAWPSKNTETSFPCDPVSSGTGSLLVHRIDRWPIAQYINCECILHIICHIVSI